MHRPAAGLDGLSASAPVGTGSGQYHRDCALALLTRQGAKKIIDRMAVSQPLDRLAQAQDAALERHGEARTNHVDVVGLHAHSVLDLAHWHGCAAAENVDHQTRVFRREVLNHHVGHTAVGSRCGEKLSERLNSPG